MEKILTFLRKNSLIFLLIMFLAVDVAFLPFIFFQNRENGPCQATQKKIFLEKDSLKNFDVKNIPKISEIKGPRIDDQAATTERVGEASASRQKAACTTLPVELWVLLLIVYVMLLIFNLTYDFKRATKLQWFWELSYTFLAIAAWYALDVCRNNIWFPLYVIKMGILTFAAYLYFFDRKK